MPKKHFIPQQWEACSDESRLPICNKVYSGDCGNDRDNNVERIVSLIEQQGADIAPSYEEWVRLGFALVDGYDENGRDYFMRLSSLHAGCTQEAAESQYDKCLCSGNSGITISTFFHLAKQAGISISMPNGKMAIWQNGNLRDNTDKQDNAEISKSQNCQAGNMEISEEKEAVNIQNAKYPYCQNGKTDISDKWIFEEEELPLFPEEVYSHLPPFLDSVMRSAISPSDRDMLLIGAITVLSSTLGKVSGVYDERIVYPNLYLFVSADAGMVRFSRELCF